jgi:hypothetical protein
MLDRVDKVIVNVDRGTYYVSARFALIMEAESTSGTSVSFYQTTRRIIPEDSHLHDRSFTIHWHGLEDLPFRIIREPSEILFRRCVSAVFGAYFLLASRYCLHLRIVIHMYVCMYVCMYVTLNVRFAFCISSTTQNVTCSWRTRRVYLQWLVVPSLNRKINVGFMPLSVTLYSIWYEI